jgi:hypothetical protein
MVIWWNPTGIRILLLFAITDDDDNYDNNNININNKSNNTQTRVISTYCTVYTMHKLLQHISTTIFEKYVQKSCWVTMYKVEG